MQGFLDIEPRPARPRDRGLTSLLDKGLTISQVDGLLESAAGHVDLVKLGWGTGYVTAGLEAKLDRYRAADIPVYLGGTLTEIAIAQGRLDDYRRWLTDHRITHIEVSEGTLDLDRGHVLEVISSLAADFTVLAEVGEKDPQAIVAPYKWVREIEENLEAGARWVVTEARETGTSGVFRPSGELREGLIEEIVNRVDPARLLFEAPLKAHQVWFIERFGRDVNLGNIAPEEAISLETLRLGLRADTTRQLLDLQ
ncbi:MAG: phosphosulfolactate synthase [Solirubrobacterales bacterium]